MHSHCTPCASVGMSRQTPHGLSLIKRPLFYGHDDFLLSSDTCRVTCALTLHVVNLQDVCRRLVSNVAGCCSQQPVVVRRLLLFWGPTWPPVNERSWSYYTHRVLCTLFVIDGALRGHDQREGSNSWTIDEDVRSVCAGALVCWNCRGTPSRKAFLS